MPFTRSKLRVYAMGYRTLSETIKRCRTYQFRITVFSVFHALGYKTEPCFDLAANSQPASLSSTSTTAMISTTTPWLKIGLLLIAAASVDASLSPPQPPVPPKQQTGPSLFNRIVRYISFLTKVRTGPMLPRMFF